MAFQFPANPTVGQQYAPAQGTTYEWNGTGWIFLGLNTASLYPAGVILPYAGVGGTFQGWLPCDGASYPTSAHPALFAAIQYAYGGSGANFNVPDLRGRVIAGSDNMFTATGAAGRLTANSGMTSGTTSGVGGYELVALAASQMPSHAHGITDVAHGHGVSDPTHAHGVYDPAHNHSLNDPTHAHSVSDGGHGHGVSDPGHSHSVSVSVSVSGTGANMLVLDADSWPQGDFDHLNTGGSHYTRSVRSGGSASGSGSGATSHNGAGVSIQGAGTGIGIYGAYTGVTANAAGTGIGIYGAGTGVTVAAGGTGLSTTNAAGGGAVHTNVQPTIALYYIIKT